MSERTSFLRWLLSRSRFLVIFAVLGSLAAAVVLFIYGSAETIAIHAVRVGITASVRSETDEPRAPNPETRIPPSPPIALSVV